MRTLLADGLAFGLVGFVAAADEKKADAKKGDPTGTWKWETDMNGQKRMMSLTLKLDGDIRTGSMPGRNNTETKIEDAAFKDGEVTFTTTRMMGDNKIVTKYKGKVDGDALKMTAETERDGKTNKWGDRGEEGEGRREEGQVTPRAATAREPAWNRRRQPAG